MVVGAEMRGCQMLWAFCTAFPSCTAPAWSIWHRRFGARRLRFALVMLKKKGRSGLVYGNPRFALLAWVLPSIASDCVTVKICVFQPERVVDESGELGKDKWRQRLLSAMAAGNPVNGALSFSLSLSFSPRSLKSLVSTYLCYSFYIILPSCEVGRF